MIPTKKGAFRSVEEILIFDTEQNKIRNRLLMGKKRYIERPSLNKKLSQFSPPKDLK